MNPDPTITISWDYLVELSDDAAQPEQPASDAIIMPPITRGTEPATGNAPE